MMLQILISVVFAEALPRAHHWPVYVLSQTGPGMRYAYNILDRKGRIREMCIEAGGVVFFRIFFLFKEEC